MSGRLRDWVIGGLILVALLYWVQTHIGWQALLAPWRRISLWQLLPLIALSLLSYLFRAVRIYGYFQRELGGRFIAVLRLSILHNFANNLLPMRAGEALFPLLMKRYFGQGMVNSALSLLWIRGLDLHFLILIAFCALYLKEGDWYWSVLALLWIGSLFLVYPLQRRLPTSLLENRGKMAGLLNKVLQALPERQGRFLHVYFWTVLTWSAKFIAFSAVLLHFLDVRLWQAIIGIMGAELSSILPFHGIAGAGSYEVGMVAVLAPLGVDADAVISGAVNLHLFLLGVTLLMGLLAMLLSRPESRTDVS